MTMHVIRDDAPGHDVTAAETGWHCVCGAGHDWEERPRTRAVAAGKRHLAAIARGDRTEDAAPADGVTITETPAEDPVPEIMPAMDTQDPDPAPWERPAQPAQDQPDPLRPPSLIDQFRSPPRDPEK